MTLVKKFVIAQLHTPEWKREIRRHVVFVPNPDEMKDKIFYDTEEEAVKEMEHLNGVYRIYTVLPVWSDEHTFQQEEAPDSHPNSNGRIYP